MNCIKIYTDGAVSNNGSEKAVGGWAAIILEDGRAPIEIFGAEANTTNQRMEIKAVLEALKRINFDTIDKLEIYSDSAYFCNCYNQKWYKKWLFNGFTNANKEPVKNKDLWVLIIDFFETYCEKINVIKVKGHSGDYYNERVDKLAVMAKESLI